MNDTFHTLFQHLLECYKSNENVRIRINPSFKMIVINNSHLLKTMSRPETKPCMSSATHMNRMSKNWIELVSFVLSGSAENLNNSFIQSIASDCTSIFAMIFHLHNNFCIDPFEDKS